MRDGTGCRRGLVFLGLAAVAACAGGPPVPATRHATAPGTLQAGGTTGTLAPGDGRQRVDLSGTALTVLTHRPTDCQPRLLMLVFHGVGRDPGPYRAHARPLADPLCAVVVAPEFDHARFPRDDYQYGGVPGVAPGGRSIDLVMPLVAWARQALGAPGLPFVPELPFVLVAHSAGAQFLDRVAAYAPPPATRILIANPSTWVLPSTTVDAPFGFGGPDGGGEAALRRYLALPIAVLLGGEDVQSRDLARGPEADAQGPTRLARGENAFHMAQETARSAWLGVRLDAGRGAGREPRRRSDAGLAASGGCPGRGRG